MTQHVVSLVPFDTEEEAYYFAAVGNSVIATIIHASSSTAKSYGAPHILKYIGIPKFNPKNKIHMDIVSLSKQCHAGAAKGDTQTLLKLEAEVDKTTAKMWGITDDELKAIQDAYNELDVLKHGGKTAKNDDDSE
jgi:hypothetical protein